MNQPTHQSRTASRSAARAAGLKHVCDTNEGIERVKCGAGFIYRYRGRPVTAAATLNRIQCLVIPPAWKEVWICRSPRGHIQATGRDARGRKQYKYHASWHAVRDQSKYARMAVFGTSLPRIRAGVRRDLARPTLSREKVLATIVKLMETTNLRVGNEVYAQSNGSYGLTTLRDRHVAVRGSSVRLCFRGKSGKIREVELSDRRLASIIRQFRDLPGQKLFQYVTANGQRETITSSSVNHYLREISGCDFTAKDFRTWAGTTLGARCLLRMEPPRSPREAKQRANEVVHTVARHLGNTDAVCRKSYIHPLVLDAIAHDALLKRMMHGPTGRTPTPVAWERFLVREIRHYDRSRMALGE